LEKWLKEREFFKKTKFKRRKKCEEFFVFWEFFFFGTPRLGLGRVVKLLSLIKPTKLEPLTRMEG